MQMERKQGSELAMFLALAFLLQSLRLLMPMIPGPVNMFLIGSLLNMIMALAIWRTRTRWAAIIGVLLPIGAFFQGQLPVAPMIPVVAAGNAFFTLAVFALGPRRRAFFAPFLKAAVLFTGTQLVLRMLDLPAPMANVLTFMMSWPQIVTGCLGIFLGRALLKRLPEHNTFHR